MSDTTSEGSPEAPPPRLARTPLLLGVGALLSVLLIVAGVLALVGGSSPGSAAPRNAHVGQVLPTFSLPSVSGSGNVVAPWASGHPAAVLFFAKWCTACHGEVPALARVLGRGSLGAVRVMGVDADSELSTAAAFVRSTGVHYPVGIDPLLVLTQQLVPQGLPAAIFVRADGRISDVQVGVMTVAQLRAAMTTLVQG